jgi:hypothetical protein
MKKRILGWIDAAESGKNDRPSHRGAVRWCAASHEIIPW